MAAKQKAPVAAKSGAVKICPDLAWKARMIAQFDGVTISELLDPLIRSTLESRFAKVGDSMTKIAKGSK